MRDEVIVRKIQAGDENLYETIIDRYQQKLFWYLKNMTNQEAIEVDDLTQETFIKAYINIQSFDCQKKFSCWIYRIAHNIGVDYFKKKKNNRKIEIEDFEEMVDDKERLIEDLEMEKERNVSVRQAIKQLDGKYREVVWLYYFEEKTYDEIAEILRIPTNRVGVLIFRAKIILKRTLKTL